VAPFPGSPGIRHIPGIPGVTCITVLAGRFARIVLKSERSDDPIRNRYRSRVIVVSIFSTAGVTVAHAGIGAFPEIPTKNMYSSRPAVPGIDFGIHIYQSNRTIWYYLPVQDPIIQASFTGCDIQR
jgi:hypothetical protein